MTMLSCIAESEIKVIHTYIHTYNMVGYVNSKLRNKKAYRHYVWHMSQFGIDTVVGICILYSP